MYISANPKMEIQLETLILGSNMSSGVTVSSFGKKIAKLRQCEQFEVQENSSENKASAWKNFKNSFAWNNWFFTLTIFFAWVNFWSFFQIWWIKKMAGAKKFIKVKYQFFHACQPGEEIFEICSCWGLIFRAVFLNFILLTLSQFCKLFAETWHSDSWGHIIS